MTNRLTYAAAGVDYDPLDAFKRMCVEAAKRTSHVAGNSHHEKRKPQEWTRGESAFLLGVTLSRSVDPSFHLAHVHEGLGTKNLVADAMQTLTGNPMFHMGIAQDTIAMALNDMITLRARPLTVAMHLAVGDTAWFGNDERARAFIAGWEHACKTAGVVWAGGETPALRDIILPGVAELSVSAVGMTEGERVWSPQKIRPGDAIVFCESSGIHANGLTLARRIAAGLPTSYLTRMGGGETYGGELLKPTHLYTSVFERCIKLWRTDSIDVNYAINITGHGWRKLMRAPQELTYHIHQLPTQLPIFDFIAKCGDVDMREMYGNFNMGAGFALILNMKGVPRLLEELEGLPFRSFLAGRVMNGPRRVVIEPVGLEFAADTLQVR